MEEFNTPAGEEQTVQKWPDEEQTIQKWPDEEPARGEGNAAANTPPQPAARPRKKDPMPFRLASILCFLFGAFNIFSSAVTLVAGAMGQPVGGAGAIMLQIMLLLIGVLQIVSGVILLKSIKQETPKSKTLCRNLGLLMLFVTAVYMVPYFLIHGFATSLISGPIVAVMYLVVQR